MIVYHKKNSYFAPDKDAKLIPMGSYVLKENEVIYVNDLNDLTVKEEEITTPDEPAIKEENTEPKIEG